MNTHAMETSFTEVAAINKNKKSIKVYGSRLDKKWLPNVLVTKLRGLN